MKEWAAATAEWENKLLVHSLLAPMDEKTLTTAYANVEGAAGQQGSRSGSGRCMRYMPSDSLW